MWRLVFKMEHWQKESVRIWQIYWVARLLSGTDNEVISQLCFRSKLTLAVKILTLSPDYEEYYYENNKRRDANPSKHCQSLSFWFLMFADDFQYQLLNRIRPDSDVVNRVCRWERAISPIICFCLMPGLANQRCNRLFLANLVHWWPSVSDWRILYKWRQLGTSGLSFLLRKKV